MSGDTDSYGILLQKKGKQLPKKANHYCKCNAHYLFSLRWHEPIIIFLSKLKVNDLSNKYNDFAWFSSYKMAYAKENTQRSWTN